MERECTLVMHSAVKKEEERKDREVRWAEAIRCRKASCASALNRVGGAPATGQPIGEAGPERHGGGHCLDD